MGKCWCLLLLYGNVCVFVDVQADCPVPSDVGAGWPGAACLRTERPWACRWRE